MKQLVLSADFETTSTPDIENNLDFTPEVYSWAIAKRNGFKDYAIQDGIDLDTFLEYLFTEINQDATIYFHNGAKFDMQFLIHKLVGDGFMQIVPDPGDKLSLTNEFDTTKKYNTLEIREKKDHKYLEFGEFTALADGSHKIMELKLAIPSTKWVKQRKGKKSEGAQQEVHNVITFRDSNLMFTSRLADYGVALNKRYETTFFTKEELTGGYTRSERYSDYDEFINDGNEQEYLHKDVIILIEFLHMMMEVIPFTKWKMTAAGTAYHVWKYDFFGDKILEKAIKDGRVDTYKKGDFTLYRLVNGKPFYQKKKQIIDVLFKRYFPTDWLEKFSVNPFQQNYDTVRDSYSGGLTMANPDYAGIKKENILYADIVSSYPTQMRKMVFPWKEPLYVTKDMKWDKHRYLALYELTIYDATNNEGLPFLKVRSDVDMDRHYSKNIKGEIFTITGEELERFIDYYEGEYEYRPICLFEKISGEYVFGDYIDYFFDLKNNATNPAEKLAAKLFLNALYGKYGQDIARMSKIYIGEYDNLWATMATVSAPQFYLPLACWITAYARLYMIDAVGRNFKLVNYLDTDSLSIIAPGVDLNDDEACKNYIENNFNMKIGTELGDWEIEAKLEWQICKRGKQYFYKEHNGYKKMKIAGLHMTKEQMQELTIKEFILGKQEIKQLRPMRFPTGIMLEEYDKQILPIWEYDLNPSYWFQSKRDYMRRWKKEKWNEE